jgi:hypothetical protein
MKERLFGGFEGVGGPTVTTQASPDLQESTAKQNSAGSIIGVNKIAPKFVTQVVTYIHVVRLFKDLTAQRIYMSFGG